MSWVRDSNIDDFASGVIMDTPVLGGTIIHSDNETDAHATVAIFQVVEINPETDSVMFCGMNI